jgi:hypothetical protein
VTVVERLNNSYRLESLEGQHIPGLFHARRLREFIPAPVSDLAIRREAERAGKATTIRRVESTRADGASAQMGGEDGVGRAAGTREQQETEQEGVFGVPEDQELAEGERQRRACMCYSSS